MVLRTSTCSSLPRSEVVFADQVVLEIRRPPTAAYMLPTHRTHRPALVQRLAARVGLRPEKAPGADLKNDTNVRFSRPINKNCSTNARMLSLYLQPRRI